MIGIYEELGDPSRRSILRQLLGGPKSVNELVGLTGLKQPNVSNHLARLRTKGILKDQKSGRQVYYTFATEEIGEIAESAFADRAELDHQVDLHSDSKEFAKAAISGDESACLEIIELAIKRRSTLIELYEELLAPAMVLIGSWYQVEAIDEAQEHLASEITLRSMARVVQGIGVLKSSSKVVILGCAENALHTIGLRMIADLLKVNGWKTIFLGANVPHPAFLSTVRQHQPHLVLVSCVSPDATQTTIDLVRKLSDQRNKDLRYLIGAGGPVVQANVSRFYAAGADFSATSLSEFSTRYLPEIERTGRINDPARSNS